MVFPCVRCGLCCRKVNTVTEMKDYDRGDGVCRHLKNNLCDIYWRRPLICDVQRMYDSYFSKKMNKKNFIWENLLVCLKLAEGEPEIKTKIEAAILRSSTINTGG